MSNLQKSQKTQRNIHFIELSSSCLEVVVKFIYLRNTIVVRRGATDSFLAKIRNGLSMFRDL